MTLCYTVHRGQVVMPLKEIKYIAINLHQYIVGQVLLKLLINYDSNLSAGKLT